MSMMRFDLVGRKAILHYLKLTNWCQVEERIRRGLPVVKEAGELRWLACSKDLDGWIAPKKA